MKSQPFNNSNIFSNKNINDVNRRKKYQNIIKTYQMLQKLPMEFAQVKVGNTSAKLFNEIRRIHYSFS